MNIKSELRRQSKRMISELSQKLKSASSQSENGEELLKNAKAYKKDAAKWLKEGKLIKAFEAVVWAFALYEIGNKLGELRAN